MTVPVRDRINQLAEEAAAAHGYEVFELGVALRGENTRIVVKIDGSAGISHNDCEIYAKELADRIDGSGVLSKFFLEISSPGFKRLIRNIGEYRRFIGSPVKIIHERDGARIVDKGTIRQADETAIVLETEQGEMTILLAAIAQANLDY